MKDAWLLHKYYYDLDKWVNRIKTGSCCMPENQKYFLDYYEYLVASGLTVPRIGKLLRLTVKVDNILKKDLKLVNSDDVIKYLGWLERTTYTEWTKFDFRCGFKKFTRWLNGGKDPEYLSLVRTTVRNTTKMLPQELLTEEEVLSMINSSPHLRDKSFLSCIYESGCRIGELLTLKIKNVTFDEYGVVLSVNGKTGVRRVRLISSTNSLSEWLTNHPYKNNIDSFVWCSYQKENNGLISYTYMRNVLRNAAKKAGVHKKVNPHSFRHARATHLANKLTEAQMKMYFGWTQASKMAAVYVHLSGRDVDDAILECYGVKRKEEPKTTFIPKKCRCGFDNPPMNKYCSKCGQILDLAVQLEVNEKKEIIKEFMKKMVEDPAMFEKVKQLIA